MTDRGLLHPAAHQPTPPGLVDAVITAGLRRRRRAVTSVAAATATTLALVVVLSAGSAVPQTLEQIPAGPSSLPSSTRTPRPSATAGHPAPVASVVPTGPLPVALGSPQPEGQPTPSPTATATAWPADPPPSHRTVTVKRSYVVMPGPCVMPGAEGPTDWCQMVDAPQDPPSGGVSTFTLHACRLPNRLPGDLTFAAGPETYFRVYRQPEDATTDPAPDAEYLWRVHSSPLGAHTLHANPGYCWRWDVSWRVVDAGGTPLPPCRESINVMGGTFGKELENFPFGEDVFVVGHADGTSCNPPLLR